MKKIVFLIVIFVFALGAGCKKKEVALPETPPPQPPPKQSEQVLLKSFISLTSQLKPGEVMTILVDKDKFTSEESEFLVQLLPLDFVFPEGKDLVRKYMFPSVVWPGEGFQLPVVDPENLETCSDPGEIFRILKESPAGTPPFENIPTLLVVKGNGEKLVFNQHGDEMPLRANWGK